MSKNTAEIPYTEIVERCRKLARVGNNTPAKIRGIVQDVAIREIPSKFDWNFMMVSSSLTTYPQYNTGTVSINTGSTAATFSSTAILDSTFSGRKIVFSGNSQVYDITSFVNTTALTISPSLQGASNITNGSYFIFQSIYPLSNDFDRFPKNGGLYQWVGNQKRILEEDPYRQYTTYTTFSPVSNSEKCRLIGTDTAGNQLVEIIPPPSTQVNYGYDYFKQSKPMAETTAGTLIQVNALSTQVNGNTNTKFLDAYINGSNNIWFRVDNLGTSEDSSWYKVLSIQNDSSLTLATAFANTGITTLANYTICASPDMPPRMHVGIIYGTLRGLELDQNDENFAFYHSQYGQVLSDSKRIYMSRPYAIDIEGIHQEYRYRY